MLADDSRVKAAETPAAVPGSRWRATCRFALSVASAGALSVWLARALRRPLAVTTDIVGYPIHANFNGFNYFNQYYVAVFFFPLASLLLYELVGRVWRNSRWPELAREVSPPGASALRSAIERVAPSLAVGLSLGSIWLVRGPTGGPRDLWIAVVLALIYVVVVSAVAAVVARRTGGEAASVLALLDAGLAPLSLLLVEAVSRSVWVAVQSPPAAHRYSPIPTGVTLTVMAVTSVVTWSRLRRARGAAARRRIELQVVLFVAIPALLFAYTAALPGPLGAIDLFHLGEQTGAANIVLQGAFPWRDVIFIHGLLQDVLAPLLGFKVFGQTIWGALAGYTFFLMPACWVSYYLLFGYLFPRRFSLVLAALSVPITASFGLIHLRFVPYPLILLALGALLATASWGRAFLLALALIAGNLMVPEVAYAVPACGVVLLAYDWSHRVGGRSLRGAFPRTSRVFVSGAVLSAFWALFLVDHGALWEFLDYYRTFAPGHELTGAIPIGRESYKDPLFVALMVLPPLLIVLAIWACIAAWRSRRPLDERDWVMIAAAIVTAAYYKKFLSRADWHVAQAFAPAIPLLFYAVHRLLCAVEKLVPSRRAESVHPIGAAMLALFLIVTGPGGVLARVVATRVHFQFTVPHEPLLAKVGWSDGSVAPLAAQVASLEQFLTSHLGPSEPIFDFTNQPGLYHFLLDLKPASRFFHVSMAIRPAAQEEVISDLKRTHPPLVVYRSETGGLGEWDGVPNVVRHHEISRFVLDHYRPLAEVSGQTFFVERSRANVVSAPGRALDARQAYLGGQRCDWGYAPNFLKSEPMVAGDRAAKTSSFTATRLEASGWAIKADRSAPAAQVVATEGQQVIGRVTTGLSRPDVAAIFGPATQRSGFHLLGEWESKSGGMRDVRLFAISAGDAADELPMPGISPSGGPPASLTVDGSVVPVVRGSVVGALDMAVVARERVTAFDLPPGLSARQVAGVEIEARVRETGTVAISAAPPIREEHPGDASASRAVVLRIPRSPRVKVRVELDSCPAWRATDGARLYIRTDEGVEIDSLRPLARAGEGPIR